MFPSVHQFRAMPQSSGILPLPFICGKGACILDIKILKQNKLSRKTYLTEHFKTKCIKDFFLQILVYLFVIE